MHEKDSTPIEAIDIDSLQQSKEIVEPAARENHSKLYIWFAFLLLLLCVLAVFLLLPKYVVEQPSKTIAEEDSPLDIPMSEDLPVIVESPPDPPPEFTSEELSKLKVQAETLLLEIIEKQKLLEDKAVKKWANQEYKIALSLGLEGDEHFRKQTFDQAIVSYKNAVNVLGDLIEQVAPTLAMHLDKGEQALIKAEKMTAKHHFELANAIDKTNTRAINGLQRAETIEELYALLEKGGKFEAANRFNKAKTTYLQATELDPLSKEAREALSRVNVRLTEIEFNRLMNQGHASLELEQYSDARAAFNAALRLAPNSNKPKQGLASIQRAQRDKKLAVLTAEAQHFENNEDWSNAADTYQQILVLSPNSKFAQVGLERSQTLNELLIDLSALNKNFLRLSSKSVSKEAQALLATVDGLDKPGGKIKQAAAKLKQQIALANQPITITLQSDEETDVAIYKIGRFGKFSNKKIELKPGKYTIVGSRNGYRDVRKEVTVLAEMSNKIIQVQCDEPI